MAALVAVLSLLAITLAGALHRSGRLDRRVTLALLITVGVAALVATVIAATIKFANCDCR